MAYFNDRDRALVEALQYDPAAEPSFELLKGCLIWVDERADGLTSDGYERLCDLWIARSFLHRCEPFSSHPLDPEYFGRVWEEALNDKIRWPGFQRLTLSAADKAYYDAELNDPGPY